MSRDLFKIETICAVFFLSFISSFCYEELSIAVSLAKFISNLSGLKWTTIIKVHAKSFHKENSDKKS